jgi:DNA-binding NarL/FixJ family response regulator
MQGIQEETTTNTKRIFIVDDHPIVRDGLAVQIANLPDVTLCGQAEDVVEAMAQIPSAKPDLVIVDISLKNSNGIELVKRLKARDGALRILVWSMYPESLYAERALRAGAQGYVNKGQSASQIMKAIQMVLDGKLFLSEEMSVKLLGRMIAGEDKKLEHFSIDALTDRELEAFELLGRGHTTQMIATKMHVSPKTVETYRARIKEKLGLCNAIELMQHAVQWAMGKDSELPAPR